MQTPRLHRRPPFRGWTNTSRRREAVLQPAWLRSQPPRWRLVAVAAPQRLAVLPQVPTFKEVGLEPVNRMAYYGIYGPKGLPREVVDKINAGVRKALEDPAVRKRIEDTGSLIVANTPEQFAAQMKAEFDVYKKVVDTQKLRLD